MAEFTHRDRRAHRQLARALWTVLTASLGLTVFALALPLWFVGLATVVAMGAVGLAYMGWSDRMLEGYSSDLRRSYDGSMTDGFVRVEVSSSVGLDREARVASSPSPHVRRRGRRPVSENPAAPLEGGVSALTSEPVLRAPP